MSDFSIDLSDYVSLYFKGYVPVISIISELINFQAFSYNTPSSFKRWSSSIYISISNRFSNKYSSTFLWFSFYFL